jgi:hypothetical protein
MNAPVSWQELAAVVGGIVTLGGVVAAAVGWVWAKHNEQALKVAALELSIAERYVTSKAHEPPRSASPGRSSLLTNFASWCGGSIGTSIGASTGQMTDRSKGKAPCDDNRCSPPMAEPGSNPNWISRCRKRA